MPTRRENTCSLLASAWLRRGFENSIGYVLFRGIAWDSEVLEAENIPGPRPWAFAHGGVMTIRASQPRG